MALGCVVAVGQAASNCNMGSILCCNNHISDLLRVMQLQKYCFTMIKASYWKP